MKRRTSHCCQARWFSGRWDIAERAGWPDGVVQLDGGTPAGPILSASSFTRGIARLGGKSLFTRLSRRRTQRLFAASFPSRCCLASCFISHSERTGASSADRRSTQEPSSAGRDRHDKKSSISILARNPSALTAYPTTSARIPDLLVSPDTKACRSARCEWRWGAHPCRKQACLRRHTVWRCVGRSDSPPCAGIDPDVLTGEGLDQERYQRRAAATVGAMGSPPSIAGRTACSQFQRYGAKPRSRWTRTFSLSPKQYT